MADREPGRAARAPLDPSTATERWHAHVHFDASTRDAAAALRTRRASCAVAWPTDKPLRTTAQGQACRAA